MLRFVIGYIVLINIVAFIVYGIDKWKAIKGRWRITELFLLFIAIFGGSVGAWTGMKLFRHKTQHKKFYIGIPLILFFQLSLVLFLICKDSI